MNADYSVELIAKGIIVAEMFEEEQSKAVEHMTKTLVDELALTDVLDMKNPDEVLGYLETRGYQFTRFIQRPSTHVIESLLTITKDDKTIFVDGVCVTLDMEQETISAESIEMEKEHLAKFKIVTEKSDRSHVVL